MGSHFTNIIIIIIIIIHPPFKSATHVTLIITKLIHLTLSILLNHSRNFPRNRKRNMRHIQLRLCLLFFIFTPLTQAKSVIEPCNTSDSCLSLLSYLLPFDSKLSEIAYRFQLNVSDLLAANSIDPANTPSLGNQILPANSLVKVPVLCPCVDGIRRSVSTAYTVRAADTVDSILEEFGGLVSSEQVRSFNGINATNPLTSGESLVIPLPCTCFNNSNNGVAAVYLSYVVQKGESLGRISQVFGTTVADLGAVNGLLGQPGVEPGDILAVPIPG